MSIVSAPATLLLRSRIPGWAGLGPTGYYITRAPGVPPDLLARTRHSPHHRPAAGSFDLLVYTNADSSIPTNWEESDPRYINNSETVKLRSFTTKVHKVGAVVSYRVDD